LKSTHSMQDDARGMSPSTEGWSHLPHAPEMSVGRCWRLDSPRAGLSRYPACPFPANNDGEGN
jgi:hypothetical protein